MGLFGTIFETKFCNICGQEIGLLGKHRLRDGVCCKECCSKLSPWCEDLSQFTVADIQQQLALRELNRSQLASFHITRTLGKRTKVFLDDTAGTFIVTSSDNWEEDNPDILKLSQITGCNLDIQEHKNELMRRTEGNSFKRWESHQPPQYRYNYDFSMVIDLNHPYIHTIRFDINDSYVEFDPISLLLNRFFFNSSGRNAEPTPEVLRTQTDYAEYEALGRKIQDVLTNTEEPESYPDPNDPASAGYVPNPAPGPETVPEYIPDPGWETAPEADQTYAPDMTYAPMDPVQNSYDPGAEPDALNQDITYAPDPAAEYVPDPNYDPNYVEYVPDPNGSQDYISDSGIDPNYAEVPQDSYQNDAPDMTYTPDPNLAQEYDPVTESDPNIDPVQEYSPEPIVNDPAGEPEYTPEPEVPGFTEEAPAKETVICPWCGAFSQVTPDGCCEYCGGSLTP